MPTTNQTAATLTANKRARPGEPPIAICARRLVDYDGNIVFGSVVGDGGTVTQITSITTGVTLNKRSGFITTVSSTLAAGVDATFKLTNSFITAGDIVLVNTKSYAGTADGIPIASCQSTANGECLINIRNTGAVTLDALIVLSFLVVDCASS